MPRASILKSCAKIARLSEEINYTIRLISQDSSAYATEVAEGLQKEGLGFMVDAVMVAKDIMGDDLVLPLKAASEARESSDGNMSEV